MNSEIYKFTRQKWSSGDSQAAKDMYAEDATIESLGKSSTGKQVRTKEENFLGVIVTIFKFRLFLLRGALATWSECLRLGPCRIPT